MLGAFRYSRNQTVLHTDAACCRPRAGALVELRAQPCAASRPTEVSYDMNRLQRLPGERTYIVT